MSKLIAISYFLITISLFVYSYGFVDLNLTLSSHPLVFNFVSWVQQLVYFDRGLSLKIFVALITLLFLLYTGTLVHSSTRASTLFPWRFIALISLILALAYPMLSSDVFKYLFVAKEIVLYHANPYLVTPNAFPDDTWIRFMRWVHTTTPYGPVFTITTIPYYLLGMGKFVPILYLFKLDQLAWYFLTIWVIGRLAKHRVTTQLYFALNPLILMEWLVNAHNDAMMIALLMLSIYLLTIQKRVWSLITLLLSIGVKYVTIFFLPFIFLKKMSLSLIVHCSLIILFLAPLLYHYSWQYQPWYATWLIPLAALSPHRWVRWTVATYSLSVFTRYLYFVGSGSWLGTPLQHALMTFLPPALILVYNGAHAVVTQAQKIRVARAH